MKRRQEVITAILQWLEERESPWSDLPTTLTDPAGNQPLDPAVVKYHIDLCEQAGFVRITGEKTRLPQIQLTWEGHRRLDSERIG